MQAEPKQPPTGRGSGTIRRLNGQSEAPTPRTWAWPIRWAKPIDSHESVLAAYALLSVLRRSNCAAGVGLIMQGGGGDPLQTWWTATSLTADPSDDGEILEESLRAVLGWVGLGDRVSPEQFVLSRQPRACGSRSRRRPTSLS
jgi:hypothetical protein